jgi:hypothetical protein
MIFLFGLIFMYFTYDFFDDFMYGIDRNQTTVENYKMIFGVRVRLPVNADSLTNFI